MPFGAQLDRRGFSLRRAILSSLVTVALLSVPSLAQARQHYMECDRPSSPYYPALLAHPATCILGLGASGYDVGPVNGHPTAQIILRKLRWRGWGTFSARARGQWCNVSNSGHAYLNQCGAVRVQVWEPENVQPAGDVPIYQRTRAIGGGGVWQPFDVWWQPGTDY